MSSLCEVKNQPEMQYNLLSVLGNRDQNDVSHTLLGMSKSPETCAAMRSSGCLPLIIRLLHAPDSSQDMKKHVALALNNIVNSNPDEAQSKLEGRVLSLLENVRQYCDNLVHNHSNGVKAEGQDKDIGMTVATILRLSFDVDQRRAMSMLGGIHSIAYLIQVLHEVYGGKEDSIHCLMLKRYASMTLTNLSSGHSSNKALLCSLKLFMQALVAQLHSPSEELQQATASVIRNLSWEADAVSKQILRETGAISILMKVAMRVQKESTLQSMLSALWNLSSNCIVNKIELCAVHGALAFLTHSLSYKSPSQKLCVIEYAGGVLRNLSSHVAEREDYRAILREHDCLQVLTQHLTSPSARVVGNACITLWNLSFDSPDDQYTLWMLGAPNLLRNLVHSKNKLIALGSSAALKNLLSGRPEGDNLYSLLVGLPAGSCSTGSSNGGANHRRNRTVEEELAEVLSESHPKKGNISPSTVTGRRDDKFVFSVTDVEKKRQHRRTYTSHSLSRSESREKVMSTLQENGHDSMVRTNCNGDRKHSSNVDLTSNEDFSKPCTEANEEKSNKLNGKYVCLFMKDDTEGDLNFNNEAISTVDELLEVVKDMASLRLNEHSTSKSVGSKNDNSGESAECKNLEESQKVQPETNNSDRKTPESTDISEPESKDSSILKAEPVTSEDCSAAGQNLEDSSKIQQPSIGDGSRPAKQERSISPDKTEEPIVVKTESFASPKELERPQKVFPSESSAKENGPLLRDTPLLDLTSQMADLELQSSLDQTPSDEIVSTEEYSVPKNVSLVSPRSIEDLSTDELTEDSSLVKKESEDSQHSLEERPSDEVTSKAKKELVTAEELERSLEELTFEEDVKEEASEHTLSDYPAESEEGLNEIGNAQYDLDFPHSDSGETSDKRQPERGSSPEVFGDYAETDLDQPTDYSLQYGEEDELTDDDEIHQGGKRDPAFYVTGVPISVHEDTVKTYCTEGTPFETPYNFSTATSMSDLRAEPSIKEEMDEVESETASVGQKDVAAAILAGGSVQVKAELVDDALILDRIHSMDSGLLSPPEKPVQFCEEGTPGQCISRFSSLSSLCGDVNPVERSPVKGPVSRGACSPCSNGGSEHGYQDIPSHSKNANAVVDQFSPARENGNDSDNIQPKLRPSVFEDAMVSFKDETTPINFSSATSLSSLSFDDEPKIPMDASLKRGKVSQRASTDLAPQSIRAKEETHTDPGLPTNSKFSHQPMRKEVFPTQSSSPGSCVLKPVTPGVRSPRVPIKQENGAVMRSPGPSNGEDADACEDYTYRFCTEGTPANISHAGSHSDLSILSIPHLRSGKLSDKIDESSDDNLSFSDEGENILAECIMSGMPKMNEAKRNCSMQSTNPDENGNGPNETFIPKKEEDGECEQTDNDKQRDDIGDRGKVVTFDNADHYAEETPLMFSRASSLASLSSFGQQSIIDDRSSIISDFSRLTSGAVSPSEIPDSPSQLVSASPHRSKAPSVGEAADLERHTKISFPALTQTTSHHTFDKTGETCVFEDDVKPFKVEDTPVEFSRATSLSSLSICDDANPAEEAAAGLTSEGREDSKVALKEEDKDKPDDKSDKNSSILESEGEEDDDAILAACVSIGMRMQQSRKPQDTKAPLFNNFKHQDHFTPPVTHSNYPVNHSPNRTNHSSSHSDPAVISPPKSPPKANQQVPCFVKIPSRCSEPVPEGGAFDDVTHRYFTEGTPSNISHAASHSDLSVLSFRSGKEEAQGEDFGRTRTTTELSDDLLNVSDNEGMLAECIKAGMPKKHPTKKRNNSLSTYPEKEVNGNFSPRHQFRDGRNGVESFQDRPKSGSSSQQLSPVLRKSNLSYRPMSANSHVSSSTTKSSHSRKSRKGAPSMEPRRVEGAGAFEDSMYRFNTEDTPASISQAGSHSDISVLSIPDDDKEFHHDFHKHNLRQHSFHNLSDESLDNSDSENILAECIQSGMPKARSTSRPIIKPSHSVASNSHSLPHHSLDPNMNFPRRSLNQVPVQQFRHGSRTAARTSRNVGFVRRSLSQSDRPHNYPVNLNHGLMMPHQSSVNDAILNRNVAAAGMWSNATTHRLPFNREKEVMNARTPPSYPNNNSYSYDSGWEMDASIVKDSQALRLMLQNQQNLRWLRKFRSTSPSNRRHSESQSSCNTFYSRENSSSMLQINGDLAAASIKGPCVQSSQAPTSLPPNIRPLDRQRTFTKLEPSLHTHLPSPSSKTKIPVPAQVQTQPKLPEKPISNSKKIANAEQTIIKGRLKSKTSVANSQPKKMDQDKVSDRVKTSKSSNGYTSSMSRASCSSSGKSTPTSTLRTNGPTTSSSSSTSSLVFKQNTTERRSFRVSRATGLEDKRSNSFSSITSSASSKSSVRPFKREVTSKVASLWKRTDTSSDDGLGKTNARNDAKNSDSDNRATVTRKMVRSATFEGLPRNLDLAKTDKITDDSQVRPSNHTDRSKKITHKTRYLIDKKEDQVNKVKSQAHDQYNKSSESVHNSRDDPCTSVINRHDRAMSIKSSTKADRSSVRITKV